MSCYGEVWISEKSCSCAIGSGAIEGWELQAELSHRVCSVSVDGPGLGLSYQFIYSCRLALSTCLSEHFFFPLRKSVHFLSKSTLFWDDIMETTVKITLGVVWLWEMGLREL